jgi:dienelactone hydrolase
VVVAFVFALMWAKERDQFVRVEFSLKTASGGKAKGIAVLPKPVAKHPVVIYIYGSGGSLLASGKELRQIAELGLAAVAIDYDQTNESVFDEQFIALQKHLKQQSWAQSNPTAWVGFGLGAQRTLSFALKYPELQPQLLVRLAGGWTPELDGSENQIKPLTPSLSPADGERVSARMGEGMRPSTLNSQPSPSIHCPVLLVHGEKDEMFPADDATRLANLLRAQGTSVALKILPEKNQGFEPDRAVVLRVVAEYCRSVLSPKEPFSEVSERPARLLVVYLMPGLVGAAFWLFLRWRTRPIKSKNLKSAPKKLETGLRWLAWGMALLALGVTAFHLVTPALAFSETTSGIARRFLVRPECREEFDFLATNSIWRGKPLKILLEHVALANYNRSLVNWKLDEQIYRGFVLSPVIESKLSTELNWRRPLWESFYPRIRKEQTTESAAQIVVRYLRERVTIVPNIDHPVGVESVWTRQIASERDFEIIYVAALRSVGVPARLGGQRRAEFYTGSVWQSAPRPIIESWASLPLGTQAPN